MQVVIRILLASAIVGGGQLSAQNRPDLDLSQVARPSRVGSDGPVTGGISSGVIEGRERPLPLEVRLLRVEPATCEWLEPITYDVEIRNTGTRPILFPWSVDPRDLGDRNELQESIPKVTISLFVSQTSAAVGGTEVLYGSQHATATHRLLARNQAVVIRATSRCQVGDSNIARALQKEESMALQVTASIHLYQDPQHGASILRSNPVALTLTRKR